ncbi:serine/threonine-protein kinase [Nocardia yamanashiensis]|uniref:serine/threonine-protein kinase n=1 Tax=Nocardia yamanashiensis TaxID=209247 RepID=UPI0008307349|nr:serine/threonine-protein kinase [Nocardia yamanashiensis]
MVLPSGSEFAGFTIVRLLGTGGMGAVYLARHPRLDREVALKILNDALAADPRTRAAFDREAAVASRLDHPNIVPVYDRNGPDDRALWLSMRHIPGGDTLRLLSSAPEGLPLDQATSLITDAAHALDHAHHSGVQHRDVKPANLLLEHDPRHGMRAVLTDFGIARTLDDTVTLSSVAATFAYAAPERFSGRPADHRADIYSLGCTLFQFLTGRTPFPRSDQAAVIGAHLMEPPPAPSRFRSGLPPGLDAVIATALAKNPDDRYPSCAELIADLNRAIAASAPSPAPVPEPRPRPQPAVISDRVPSPEPMLIPGAPPPKAFHASTEHLAGQANPERPAPRLSRRRVVAALAIAGVAAGLLIGYNLIRANYFVAADNGRVVVLRGMPDSVLGLSIRDVDQVGCVTESGELTLVPPGSAFPSGCRELKLADFRATGQYAIAKGLPSGSREEADKQLRSVVERELLPACAPSAGSAAATPAGTPAPATPTRASTAPPAPTLGAGPATTSVPATGAAQAAGQTCRSTG